MKAADAAPRTQPYSNRFAGPRIAALTASASASVVVGASAAACPIWMRTISPNSLVVSKAAYGGIARSRSLPGSFSISCKASGGMTQQFF